MTANYIIDPKIFWFIDIAGAIEMMLGILAFLAFAGLVVYLFGGLIAQNWDLKPIFIILLSLTLFTGAIGASVIPTKDTMILMTAASVATYDNVENVTDEIYKIIDYIDEAIED